MASSTPSGRSKRLAGWKMPTEQGSKQSSGAGRRRGEQGASSADGGKGVAGAAAPSCPKDCSMGMSCRLLILLAVWARARRARVQGVCHRRYTVPESLKVFLRNR